MNMNNLVVNINLVIGDKQDSGSMFNVMLLNNMTQAYVYRSPSYYVAHWDEVVNFVFYMFPTVNQVIKLIQSTHSQERDGKIYAIKFDDKNLLLRQCEVKIFDMNSPMKYVNLEQAYHSNYLSVTAEGNELDISLFELAKTTLLNLVEAGCKKHITLRLNDETKKDNEYMMGLLSCLVVEHSDVRVELVRRD